MKVLFETIGAALFIVLLWQIGQWADALTQGGQLTAASVAAILLVLFLAIVALAFAVLPAIVLYDPEDLSGADFRIPEGFVKYNPGKHHVVFYMVMSYATTIYLFAVIYKIITNFEADAFKLPIEGLGTATYFSIMTIATVGYGDIVPVTALSRSAVSCEVLIGIAYVVFFLSIIAAFLREDFQRRPRQ